MLPSYPLTQRGMAGAYGAIVAVLRGEYVEDPALYLLAYMHTCYLVSGLAQRCMTRDAARAHVLTQAGAMLMSAITGEDPDGPGMFILPDDGWPHEGA